MRRSAPVLLAALLGAVPAGWADDSTPIATPEAIQTGKKLYRQICIVCHLKAGGRGPNLFRNTLGLEKFTHTVLTGREGTEMTAFADRLTPEEIAALYAFVMSRDRY